MQNIEQNSSLKPEDESRQKTDANSGNNLPDEMLQTELIIDPGNEHHHPADVDDAPGSDGTDTANTDSVNNK